MLVSHEVPISLLKYSQNFNDYDYCLLHLTYDHQEYKNYYIDAIKKGRKVLQTSDQQGVNIQNIHRVQVQFPIKNKQRNKQTKTQS